MTDYYFLKRRDTIFGFDISIEHYIDTDERRIIQNEALRLCYIKETDKFKGRYVHEKFESPCSFYKTISELVNCRLKDEYIQIDARNYNRYKKTIPFRYQRQINQKNEKANRR